MSTEPKKLTISSLRDKLRLPVRYNISDSIYFIAKLNHYYADNHIHTLYLFITLYVSNLWQKKNTNKDRHTSRVPILK